jgi:hypothetical protein
MDIPAPRPVAGVTTAEDRQHHSHLFFNTCNVVTPRSFFLDMNQIAKSKSLIATMKRLKFIEAFNNAVGLLDGA